MPLPFPQLFSQYRIFLRVRGRGRDRDHDHDHDHGGHGRARDDHVRKCALAPPCVLVLQSLRRYRHMFVVNKNVFLNRFSTD